MAKKCPDPDDLGACACANLRMAARAITQAYDAALQPHGLKATQFTVLAALSRRRALALSKLAEALVMDRTTLSRNLKPLIAKGWVRIETEADQRVRVVALTAAGEAVLESARPAWLQAQHRFVGTLGKARWAGLMGDLGATVTAARDR